MPDIVTKPPDLRPRLLRIMDAFSRPGITPLCVDVAPRVVCSVAWRRWIEALDRFLDSHSAVPIGSPAGPDSPVREKELARERDDYEQLIYRTAEFYEAVCQTLRDSVCTSAEVKQWSPRGERGLRRHHSMICNKLKHNGRVMVTSEITTFMFNARGFGIYATVGAGPHAPDPEIHARLKAFSYRADLANMLANVFNIAEAISDELGKLGAPADGVPFEDAKSNAALARVASLPIGPFPGEKSTNTASIKFSEGALHISQSGASLMSVMGFLQARAKFIADGHTNSFCFSMGYAHGPVPLATLPGMIITSRPRSVCPAQPA